MKVRKFYKTDLETINSWMRERNQPEFLEFMLPYTGFIAEDVCAGFLYKTDSSLAWLEWLVTNPMASSIERHEALDLVIDNLVSEAKAWGAKAIFTSTDNQQLVDRYTRHKFLPTDTKVTHLIRGIE